MQFFDPKYLSFMQLLFYYIEADLIGDLAYLLV